MSTRLDEILLEVIRNVTGRSLNVTNASGLVTRTNARTKRSVRRYWQGRKLVLVAGPFEIHLIFCDMNSDIRLFRRRKRVRPIHLIEAFWFLNSMTRSGAMLPGRLVGHARLLIWIVFISLIQMIRNKTVTTDLARLRCS